MSDILALFRADVRSRRGRIGEVSAATGIKVKTLRKYLYEERRDPRSSYLEKLREFYENRRAA